MHLKTKYMYIFNLRRVLAHYEFSENSLTTSSDIINHSELFKENIPSSLDSKILGRIISDLWKGEVQPVRRGPRNHQQRGYLNLSRKCESNVATCSPEGTHTSLISLELPAGWKYEVSANDVACFYRREELEFNGQRVTLELMVDMSLADGAGTLSKFKIKSHGFQTDLESILGTEFSVSDLNFKDQVKQVIRYLEKSLICRGIPIGDDESIITSNPHLIGEFVELSDPAHKRETRAFSKKCQVISTGTGMECKNCKALMKVNNQRRSRKEKRSQLDLPASLNCNKRFLSKEEVVEQLKEENRKRKNAESRENYWKEKFANEALELEKEDESDLQKIFLSVKKHDVPEDAKCLWEQQEKILKSNSPEGYRWHPKYVTQEVFCFCVFVCLFCCNVLVVSVSWDLNNDLELKLLVTIN